MNGSTAQNLNVTAPGEENLIPLEFLPYGPHRDKASLERAATSPLSVMISGETGTGKEILARTIHMLSDRRSKKFLAIDCGAISESLIESELFGHRKGAFTGALSNRRGYVEEAQGGTLFLDEITKMSLAMQAHLLRVLQQREVVPVGETKPVSVDIRVISATNQDPQAAIKAGRLSDDLFYRLNDCILSLPALRDQPQDVVPLAQLFLQQAAREKDVGAILTQDAEDLLASPRQWPGNIRQLRAVMRKAFYLHAAKEGVREIAGQDLDPLPALCEERSRPASQVSDEDIVRALSERSFPEMKKLYEAGQKSAVMRALDETGGMTTTAAKKLKALPHTITEMMRRAYGTTPRKLWLSMHANDGAEQEKSSPLPVPAAPPNSKP
jgi:sigma-54-specific transcriptional regulator